MIQANELRTGNLLLYKNSISGAETIVVIDAIKRSIASMQALKLTSLEIWLPLINCSPIPLTPELLEQCGFEKCPNGTQLRVFEGYVFINSLFSKTGFPLTLEIDGNRMPLHEIKNLHQLQNLYFALTGEELTTDLLEKGQ